MKRILLFSIIIHLTLTSFGQVIDFLPIGGSPSNLVGFEWVLNSSVAFVDIDNDNDLDVLIAGKTAFLIGNPSVVETKLYKNDGNGNFTEVIGTPFVGIEYGSISFFDIDNDNDADLLLTGSNSAKLYSNDGNGVFTEIIGTPFSGVTGSSVDVADIDNDNDLDVLITGSNSAKLYSNDGNGVFTEIIGTPFSGVSSGSIAFADIDNDNDLDVLITGSNSAKLYSNDGNGVFTEIIGTPFSGVSSSSIAFADIDNDNDFDVLITGQTTSTKVSKLYKNDGNGVFTLVATPFEGVVGCVSFSDIDNDNDFDVLITGRNIFNDRIAKLYSNNGFGNFTYMSNNTSLAKTANGSIAFADIDNDNDQDLLITGETPTTLPITRLYINDGNGTFQEVIESPFHGVDHSSVAFADVNNDNFKDVLISGTDNFGDAITKLYANVGNGTWTQISTFAGSAEGSIAFADIDNDNDLDVVISGKSGTVGSRLYKNDGNGIFTFVNSNISSFYIGDMVFADFDNDNDQDLLITGTYDSFTFFTKLYANDGNGTFTQVLGTPFETLQGVSLAVSDIDNDNDFDFFIIGNSFSKLYVNNGLGVFTLKTVGSPSVATSSGASRVSEAAFADIDNDNDQDLLIIGAGSGNYAYLFLNNGMGDFTQMSTTINNTSWGSIAFADVDNDNDKDVLISGDESGGVFKSKLYINNGFGNFSFLSGMPFDGVYESSVVFSDVDNDNRVDVLISGFKNDGKRISKLYKNITCYPLTGIDIRIECDSLLWIDGNTYTSSTNTPTFTLTNTIGCDSVVTLNLTINNSTSSTDIVTACDSITWIDGNIYSTGTNLPTFTLTNAVGCDSVVTLNLTIQGTSSTDIITTCDSITWLDGNTYTSSTNTPTFVLTNAAGCDSVITLNLTINNPTTGVDTQVACDNLLWIDGLTYTSSTNTPTFILTNAAGCDSVVTLNLTILTATTGVDTQVACDSLTWIDGNTYTSSTNTPTFILPNVAGCDSTITLNLSINNLIASYTSIDNGNGNYSFTNTSSGNFNQTHWAFGDGATSTAANPNHTFSANGTYVVVLTVNDSTVSSSCMDYYLDTIVVTGVVAPLQCAAGFVMYPDAGGVTVVNSSTGTNLTYLWDFGDGNTSTQAYPTHTYATADNYYLCLTVDDGAGCVNMYCDSIGENGVVFNKQTGFTINVIAPPLVTQVSEQEVLSTSMSIYPNPTGSLLNVVFKQNELYQLKITAIDGKIIDAKTINGNTIFDVSKYSSGMYFISASNKEGKVFQSKFVKE